MHSQQIVTLGERLYSFTVRTFTQTQTNNLNWYSPVPLDVQFFSCYLCMSPEASKFALCITKLLTVLYVLL